MEGRENGRASGGAIFGAHGGAMEGRSIDPQSILYPKKSDFCN